MLFQRKVYLFHMQDSLQTRIAIQSSSSRAALIILKNPESNHQGSPGTGSKHFFAQMSVPFIAEIFLTVLVVFINRTIFNEDMIYAAKAIQAGYSVAYAADARVIHSHNYTANEQFHRNFDIGVSQADYPEVFLKNIASESEGIKMVKQTAAYLKQTGKAESDPNACDQERM